MAAHTEFTPATLIVASPDQLSTTLSGETVILQMTDGAYYGLDAVGTRIWALIKTPASLANIAAVIVEEYEVSAPQAMADLIALANELLARKLIEIAPA